MSKQEIIKALSEYNELIAELENEGEYRLADLARAAKRFFVESIRGG